MVGEVIEERGVPGQPTASDVHPGTIFERGPLERGKPLVASGLVVPEQTQLLPT